MHEIDYLVLHNLNFHSNKNGPPFFLLLKLFIDESTPIRYICTLLIFVDLRFIKNIGELTNNIYPTDSLFSDFLLKG